MEQPRKSEGHMGRRRKWVYFFFEIVFQFLFFYKEKEKQLPIFVPVFFLIFSQAIQVDVDAADDDDFMLGTTTTWSLWL